MQQAHRFTDAIQSLFDSHSGDEDKKAAMSKYMMKFRFLGYKIYTLAWKDSKNLPELQRDYLATRVSNSEFLKHVHHRMLPRISKIFSHIQPRKSFRLSSIYNLCSSGQPLYQERIIKYWDFKKLSDQATRL